ncbi:uncharacterized protein N0V89_006684 [Didymosphaeria variabile]|uniref:Uncharacterized protein n=1 Tax=Didymosphaeria variabile TaxID=1932322 RepID=A0A9W8XI28_9PLEO|nr:uncharacterized protein N0V89_006684 [Didymosphaeria variabile]KAJ4351344.1 hypothetical protein N0V89_006684 [Didymosphaeria variabile]
MSDTQDSQNSHETSSSGTQEPTELYIFTFVPPTELIPGVKCIKTIRQFAIDVTAPTAQALATEWMRLLKEKHGWEMETETETPVTGALGYKRIQLTRRFHGFRRQVGSLRLQIAALVDPEKGKELVEEIEVSGTGE